MILKQKVNRKFNQQWQLNSFSSKDSKETCTVHSKSNNIEIMISNETDEIIE